MKNKVQKKGKVSPLKEGKHVRSTKPDNLSLAPQIDEKTFYQLTARQQPRI